jgi:hypothetical protein
MHNRAAQKIRHCKQADQKRVNRFNATLVSEKYNMAPHDFYSKAARSNNPAAVALHQRNSIAWVSMRDSS